MVSIAIEDPNKVLQVYYSYSPQILLPHENEHVPRFTSNVDISITPALLSIRVHFAAPIWACARALRRDSIIVCLWHAECWVRVARAIGANCTRVRILYILLPISFHSWGFVKDFSPCFYTCLISTVQIVSYGKYRKYSVKLIQWYWWSWREWVREERAEVPAAVAAVPKHSER